jgi:hypothetical protein
MGAVVLTSVAFSLFFAWLSLHGLLRLLSRMSSARR